MTKLVLIAAASLVGFAANAQSLNPAQTRTYTSTKTSVGTTVRNVFNDAIGGGTLSSLRTLEIVGSSNNAIIEAIATSAALSTKVATSVKASLAEINSAREAAAAGQTTFKGMKVEQYVDLQLSVLQYLANIKGSFVDCDCSLVDLRPTAENPARVGLSKADVFARKVQVADLSNGEEMSAFNAGAALSTGGNLTVKAEEMGVAGLEASDRFFDAVNSRTNPNSTVAEMTEASALALQKIPGNEGRSLRESAKYGDTVVTACQSSPTGQKNVRPTGTLAN